MIAKFLNTSVVYAFIYFFSNHIDPLDQNGITSVLSSLVIVSAGLNIVFSALQPSLYYNQYKNSKYYRMKKVNIFQIQLNQLF